MKSQYTISVTMAMTMFMTMSANAQVTDTHSPSNKETLTAEELDDLPFDKTADVTKVNLYSAIDLDDLIRFGVIGAQHDIKMQLNGNKYNRLEIPGYRVRLDTLLGYDPNTDAVRPYQTVFDPNVDYTLRNGGFDISGDGFQACEGFASVYASGNYLYLEREEVSEGNADVQCPISVLMQGYALMDFFARDRPEMYEIRQRESKSESSARSLEKDVMMSM